MKNLKTGPHASDDDHVRRGDVEGCGNYYQNRENNCKNKNIGLKKIVTKNYL